MELSRPMPLGQAHAAVPAAQLAKTALRRLALSKLEPTPENYARAYDEELGVAQRPVLPQRALALLQRMAASLLRDEAARQSFAQSFTRGRWHQIEQLLDAAAADEAACTEGLAQLLERLLEGVDRGSRQWDHVARFGGEEFVVLLPESSIERRGEVLSRMQRALTASLFMHEGDQIFVTFSAGLTLYRDGESIESALERADEALYEAKRTGKNRTCVA